MFVAFIPLHILLYDEVLPYFILHVEVFCGLKLNLNQTNLNLYKIKCKVDTANPYSAAILDDLPDKMDHLRVPTITCLIDTHKFDQAL
jgi:hypothetical protein